MIVRADHSQEGGIQKLKRGKVMVVTVHKKILKKIKKVHKQDRGLSKKTKNAMLKQLKKCKKINDRGYIRNDEE